MAVLDDLGTYLDTSSTAFTKLTGSGGNLAKAVLLDNSEVPSTVAVLYETPGVENVYTYATTTGRARVAMERPSVQLICRSTNYSTARTLAGTAYTILDGLAGKRLPTSTGTLYHEITAAQAPFFLQRDENDRYLVAVNFNVTKRPTST